MPELLLQGAQGLLAPGTVIFLFAGVVVGLVFGVIPGLGGTTALALLLPLTYGMEVTHAFAMAGGIMGAIAMGGSISAILLNAPGTGPSAATCLDGHPLAKQGRAADAIGAVATASPLGGLFGVLTLLLVLPVAREIVLLFGPPEFFLVAVFGIVTVAISSSANLLRGLVAGGIGLMLSFVGYDTVHGGVRYTLGSDYLWDGIPLIPALVGLFGMAEMIRLSIEGGTVAADASNVKLDGVWTGMRATLKHWKVVIRGSITGTLIGAIPGVGGTVATFIAYSTTKKADRDPDSFGTGRIEGIVAPESANNAKDSGALLPTLAFGIPGSAEMAVFLGILMLHGMQPGPAIFADHQQEIYGLILALTFSAVLASIIGITFVRWLAAITLVKGQILAPVVIAVSLVGVYAINLTPGDVVMAAILGVLGYLMLRFDYPRLPLVIALILGETAERGFQQSMMIGKGDLSIFVHSATSIVLVVLILLSLSWSFVPMLRNRFAARISGEVS
ncbi:MAG: tripartite tricarboxylate transporter permease [Gammaproteobacteria bacterium]|nr:tripartite tricarboxylate transporter permease [Gammaproteobacteria bacterium]